MQESLPLVIAGAIGAIVTSAINYLSSADKNKSSEQTVWREGLLQRQDKLEKRVDGLDSQIMLWKARYWSMYSWLVKLCVENNFSIKPPPFHDMDLEALQKEEQKNNSDD
ncbi:MAG: hypothetical protein WEA58_03940 [Balneolaceae bacterium]